MLPLLKSKVKASIEPSLLSSALSETFPPLLLHARCSTWMDWVIECLEVTRYGGVATEHMSEFIWSGFNHQVCTADTNGETLVKHLTELGTISHLVLPGTQTTKRHVIVRHLHRIPLHFQHKIKNAIDTCQSNCTLIFTTSSLNKIHYVLQSRCGAINCNPPKASWPALMLGMGPESAINSVIDDSRSDTVLAAVLLLEHVLIFDCKPKDRTMDYFKQTVALLGEKATTLASALACIRQAGKFACNFRLNLSDVVYAIVRSVHNGSDYLKIASSMTLEPGVTQRHTLVAIETFLWHIYALGQGVEPVL